MSLILNGTTGISDVDGTAAAPALTGTDSNTGIFFPAADTIAFAEGGVEAMRIDSSGNVGIGISAPVTKLDVSGVATATPVTNGIIRILTTGSNPPTGNGGGLLFTQVNSGSTNQDYASITGSRVDSSANNKVDLVFSTGDPTGSVAVAERMRINTSGNVGIGTSAPNAAFKTTIAGQGLATTRVNIGDVAGSLDGSSIFTSSDSVNGANWTPSNASYRFGANRGGCVVAINPSGFTYEGGSAVGTRTFAVNANGNVQNTNNSYGSLSDAKLKENVTDATPKLESLMRVKVRNFNLIADEAKIKQIGVVAQELEEVFPSMIDQHIDYTFESYVREDGVTDSRGVPTGTVTKEVKYSVFVPMLIKAIQEQQALITALTTRITALEAI